MQMHRATYVCILLSVCVCVCVCVCVNRTANPCSYLLPFDRSSFLASLLQFNERHYYLSTTLILIMNYLIHPIT